jgi:hypothetical protein
MIPMNNAATQLTMVINTLEKNFPVEHHIWEKGDLLVLNNFKLLHSRGTSEVTDIDRILTRALII